MDRYTLHPNTKSALALLVGTVVSVAAVVFLFNFGGSGWDAANSQKILFAQHDGNDYEIFVMEADGSGLRQLTDNDVDDWGPSLSPDGFQFAFRSYRDGMARVFVMNLHNEHVRPVTAPDVAAGSPLISNAPAWSPDGQYLATEVLVDGNWDIYVVGLGCTSEYHMYRVTDHDEHDGGPSFSPDGRQIAFHSYRDGEAPDIYVVNLDGTGTRRVTYDSSVMDVFPVFSPDGSEILFHSERDGNSEIYIMNADGSNPRNISQNPALDRIPRFSADGEQILFRSERAGDSELFVMNRDGSDVHAVTDNDLEDLHSDW